MIVLNQYIIHGSCPFLEVCTKWIMVPSEPEKHFLCWKVNMAGVVAAKLKLKKQQQEEEAAQVSKDKNFYVLSKLIKKKTHRIEFFLIFQNKFDPNWSAEEKEAYYKRKQKTTFKVELKE